MSELPPPPTPRLVLLYAPCTVSKRHLAPYADGIDYTPNLARFGAEAVRFERQITETGQSGPSFASLFTGTGAERHGVFRHPTRLLDDALLLAEVYAAAGYETFYWNGHGAASARLNFAQGVREGNVFAKGLEPTDAGFVAILERLAEDPDYKAFVFTNSTVAHGPYRTRHVDNFLRLYPGQLPAVVDASDVARYGQLYSDHAFALSWNHAAAIEELVPAHERDAFNAVVELLYASGIERLDRLFGAVIDRIRDNNLLEDSLIAFTADHGELLYREHVPFKWNHLMLLANEVLEVPLLVRSPVLQPGTYDGVTRGIDVFPTLLGLSGIEVPDEVTSGPDGEDLSVALRGGSAPPQLVAQSHTAVLPTGVVRSMHEPEQAGRWDELRARFPDARIAFAEVALRDGDLSLRWVRDPAGEWRFELYDVAADPEERTNLFEPDDRAHQRLAELLRDYKRRLAAGYQLAADARDVPRDEEDEILRSLGYIQ